MLASVDIYIEINFSGSGGKERNIDRRYNSSSIYFNKIVTIKLYYNIKFIDVLFEASIAFINIYVF